jgi:hypothetical protein
VAAGDTAEADLPFEAVPPAHMATIFFGRYRWFAEVDSPSSEDSTAGGEPCPLWLAPEGGKRHGGQDDRE